MKKFLLLLSLVVVALTLIACNGQADEAVQARAVFELARVYLDEQAVEVSQTSYSGSSLTFVGEENGGNVIIRVGDVDVFASINPSREHPSFESGYWHHHLYAGATAAGSPRINFQELLPDLGIDDNAEADDNTQSAYQHGNLHYIVATEEFRLRFVIDGVVHDLLFTQV